MRAGFINEIFTNDNSDPIKDMGIGMQQYWTREAKKFGRIRDGYMIKKYFDGIEPDLLAGVVIYETLNNASLGSDIQTAFVDACESCGYAYPRAYDRRKVVANVLKKYFYANVNPNFSVNEKFTQDSDPIEDMGIGIKYKLDKWVSKISKIAGWHDTHDIDIRLRMAAFYGKLEFVKYLLNIGANVNADDGMPLINAVRNHHFIVAKYLIKRRANINKLTYTLPNYQKFLDELHKEKNANP
jgi:hypothetical protein